MANQMATFLHADMAALVNEAQGKTGAILPGASLGDASADADISFSQTLREAVGKVNADDSDAARRMADVDSGKSDDLVGAMLASQEASLSFSMLMQVRNKVMGAVDDLIKLPL
jgi:flagellar hook-basal body complex protein FliE